MRTLCVTHFTQKVISVINYRIGHLTWRRYRRVSEFVYPVPKSPVGIQITLKVLNATDWASEIVHNSAHLSSYEVFSKYIRLLHLA